MAAGLFSGRRSEVALVLTRRIHDASLVAAGLLQDLDDKGCFGAGNETRTRDLNLGKIVPQIS